MEGDKTHWKKLTNPNYIGAYSMPTDGTDVILTIKNVTQELVKGENGKQENCTVAYFKEESKPMILNKTNCKTISSIYKTPYIEEWPNKKIQIFTAQVKVGGEVVDALRIRPFEPKVEKPQLLMDTPNFKQAKEYMQKEGSKIEMIEKKYTLSKEVKEALCTN